MARRSRKLLLFDLGGVVLENATFERLNVLLPEPVEIRDLKERWLSSAAVRAFELGKTAPTEFAEEFIAEWPVECTASAFIAEFAKWPTGLFHGAAELLALLRQRYRTACLSNSNELHWSRFERFENHFDECFSSHLLGAIKPDRECFELVLKLLDADPSDVTFFDDSEASIQMAAGLGMTAIHVDGFAELVDAVGAEHLLG
jgi:putative hydrolase of the HAD superfamily